MNKTWILGASGFIGSYLRSLIKNINEDELVCVTTNPLLAGNAEYIYTSEYTSSFFDFLSTHYGSSSKIFIFTGSSTVKSASLAPHLEIGKSINPLLSLLEFLRVSSIPSPLIIFASSAAVYGEVSSAVLPSSISRPTSLYGLYKQCAENLLDLYCSKHGVRAISVRIFSVYGPNLKKQLFWDCCNKLSSNQSLTLHGSGTELRDWIHVSDVCQTLLNISESSINSFQLLNIGTGKATSVLDFATLFVNHWANLCNCDVPNVIFPLPQKSPEPNILVADLDEFVSNEVTKNYNISTGIYEYINWFLGAKV